MAGMPIVEMTNIKKSFGAVQALRGVDLLLNRGEVLGLVGDNAAGKSTLMKVLSGAYIPDEGQILIDSKKVHITNPETSRHLGVEMVYQDYALVDNLQVSANVFLGREIVRWQVGPLRVMDKKAMDEHAINLMDRLRIDIDSVQLKVENLSGGQRQAVAIGRSIAFDAKVIIMDEPTAALSVAAIGKVLELIRELKSFGSSIIVISHRLEDIYEVSDRVIVLRHGRKVADCPIIGNISEFRERIVSYMVGARDDFSISTDD